MRMSFSFDETFNPGSEMSKWLARSNEGAKHNPYFFSRRSEQEAKCNLFERPDHI
jgi:hypothetical protein